MPTMTGGDVLIEAIAREGIRHVFSCPGGQFLPIYDAIREHPAVELIVPRHEGAGAIMSCGYALATGAPSVVMSTVGAGVIYEAAGLLLAWRERLPVLSIAPQVQSYRMKPIQESLQACDQDEIFRTFTKFRAIIYHYDRIPQILGRAIRIAAAPEPGPIHLDLPVDVIFEFKRVGKKRMAKLFPPGLTRFEGRVFPGEESIARAAELVNSAERPVVLAGREIERSRAGESLAGLLAAASVPVITSTAAFASVSADNSLNLGLAGAWMGGAEQEALAKADLLVLLEADEDTARLAAGIKRANPAVKVVQAAELAASIGSLVPVDAGLVGSAGPVMDELATRLDKDGPRSGGRREFGAGLKALADKLKDKAIAGLGQGPRLDGLIASLELIAATASEDDFVVCEGLMAAAVASARLKRQGLHNVVLLPDESMPGVGLPLGQGIKAARPANTVFLVTDTGRLKRHAREFQTSSRYKLSVTTLVFQALDKKPEEEVSFADLASGLGIGSRKVVEPCEDLTASELAQAAAHPGGMCFDVSE